MPASGGHRVHRLSLRLSRTERSLIDHAARRTGCSRQEFVRSAALRAAEAVVLDGTEIRMSPENFADFLAIIDQRAVPVPELVTVLRRRPPWESGANDGDDGAQKD
jgi:uncharacterized protein (DUF1778 family)